MRSILTLAITVGCASLAAQAPTHTLPTTVSRLALEQIAAVSQATGSLATPEGARAGGFEPVLGWIPMMGTHWVNGPRMLEGKAQKITEPSQLMFSPIGGRETLVGAAFAYYTADKDGKPPAIFDGDPPWHDHPDLAPPGTNLVMLHVWFVESPDGPFAGHNPFLPYWAAGLTPPDVARMRDPGVSLRVRKAALALAEVVDDKGLFPIVARRPAVRPVLEEHRAAIRARLPEIEAARKEDDQKRWDDLTAELARDWDAMRDAYLKSIVDPTVNARIVEALDNMLAVGHEHHK